MRFPYLRYASSSSSRAAVYRPVIPFRVRGGAGEIRLFGLIDTGADTTVLPRFLADRIGARLETTRGKYRGVGGQSVTVSYGVVELLVDDGIEFRWSARVAFLEGRTIALLGQSGFLEHFGATFRGADHEIVLERNAAPLPDAP